MKDLQEKGLGEKDESVALIVQQVRKILNNEFLNSKMLQSLLYRVFCHIATIFAYRDTRTINEKLKPNQNWYETGIWYLKTHCSLNRVGNFIKDIRQKVKIKLLNSALTNYSRRKTAAQILQDANIPEDAIINVIEYKSSQELASNINPINQESSVVLTEITGSHINFNTNTIVMQDINMVQ
ncbi:16113_t:CDS:2, partial [Gigaspora margarita]